MQISSIPSDKNSPDKNSPGNGKIGFMRNTIKFEIKSLTECPVIFKEFSNPPFLIKKAKTLLLKPLNRYVKSQKSQVIISTFFYTFGRLKRRFYIYIFILYIYIYIVKK
jgi:hypothetical protein